jgi:uncharacterized glyoxalase superfamily protein PhnB
MSFGACTPIFRSFDEGKAREFYIDFLGFEVTFEHRFEPSSPLYMGLRLGDAAIHLSEHHGDATPGGSVRIRCDDVAALCTKLNEKKYRHARPGFQDTEWGTREMVIGDPFHNRVIFWQDKPKS